MNIAMTGQRPKSLDQDYTYTSDLWVWVRKELTSTFTKMNPQKIITGMALGVDTVAAEVALTMEIPYIAAVPFPGQENTWTDEQKIHYNHLLNWAEDVEFVSDANDHKGVYQVRNQWMVDRADIVVAVWNGFKGGTRNCIEYAIRKEVPVWRLDPTTKKIGRYDGTKHIVKELAGA